MKSILKILMIFAVVIVIKLVFFYPPNKNVKLKLDLIESELSRLGYKSNWVVISGKRHIWYNKILPNASKNSNHLKGTAIDIFVFDINWDNKFNNDDIVIFEKVVKDIENKYPNLKGGMGTYRNKGLLTKHMIHIDTDGSNKRWY